MEPKQRDKLNPHSSLTILVCAKAGGHAASAAHPAARGAPLKPSPLPQREPRGCQGSVPGMLPAMLVAVAELRARYQPRAEPCGEDTPIV